jgi:hypothetical protein
LLGSIIPFLHFYDNQVYGNYVVHHIDLVNNIECGIASLSPSPGTKIIPDQLNPTLNFNYFNTMINSTLPSNTMLQISETFSLSQQYFSKHFFSEIEHVDSSLPGYQ